MSADILPPECDFCDQPIDEDEGEELTPVWIGDPPKPKGKRSEGFMAKPRTRQQMNTWSVLGLQAWEIGAVINALMNHPWVEHRTHNSVERVTNGGAVFSESTISTERVNIEHDDDTAVAVVNVTPDIELPSPDMMLCEYCTEGFSSG